MLIFFARKEKRNILVDKDLPLSAVSRVNCRYCSISKGLINCEMIQYFNRKLRRIKQECRYRRVSSLQFCQNQHNKDKENWRSPNSLYSGNTVSLMYSGFVAQPGLPKGCQIVDVEIDIEVTPSTIAN